MHELRQRLAVASARSVPVCLPPSSPDGSLVGRGSRPRCALTARQVAASSRYLHAPSAPRRDVPVIPARATLDPSETGRGAVVLRAVRAVIAIIGVAIAALPVGAQQSALDRALRDTVLANGLHVIVLRNTAVPIATVKVVIRTGAFTQLEPADEGVPHLLEHMLFKSYGNGGTEGFARAAANLHAGYNGTTGDEAVTYYLTLPSRNTAGAIRLAADLMDAPRFRAAELATEQRVVRGELERNVADPQFLLNVAVNRLLWGSAFGRKHAIGNVLSIMGADPERLQRTFERYYVPNNAALVVTGDVESEEVFAQAARYFGSWKRGEDPFARRPIPPIPPLERDTVLVLVEGEVGDVTVLLRWQGPSVRDDPEATFAADVFSALVNSPYSGLQKRLVESGLFQSVSMQYVTLGHVGPITLMGRTTPEQVTPALQALRSEIARFDDPEYFTEEELRIARKRQEVDVAFELEAAATQAHTIGFWWSVAGLDYYRGYATGMASRSAEDLRVYVQRYIIGQPKVIGLLISEATRTAHGQQIALGLSQWFW